MFLVDDSSSILPSEWPQVLEFLVSATRLFTVGRDNTRIGIVQYSTDANIIYRLTSTQTESAVIDAIRRMQHPGGSTNLAAAMRLAFSAVFVTAQREGAAKVCSVYSLVGGVKIPRHRRRHRHRLARHAHVLTPDTRDLLARILARM